MTAPVAALFVRADSAYKALPGVDSYDAARDARTFDGPYPVVAHPPCRAWGRLRGFAKPREDERALALFAVAKVRGCGGVLEHPEGSTLWDVPGSALRGGHALPKPGAGIDAHGGYTIAIDQFNWGHRARKRTWLYIVGVAPAGLPELVERPGEPTHCVRPTKAYPRLPSITKREREHTPVELCRWLVEVARRCAGHFSDYRMAPQTHPGEVVRYMPGRLPVRP